MNYCARLWEQYSKIEAAYTEAEQNLRLLATQGGNFAKLRADSLQKLQAEQKIMGELWGKFFVEIYDELRSKTSYLFKQDYDAMEQLIADNPNLIKMAKSTQLTPNYLLYSPHGSMVNSHGRLVEFDILSHYRITNFESLAQLTALEELFIEQAKSNFDLSFIQSMPNLNILALALTSLETINLSAQVPSLERLDLFDSSFLVSLDFVKYFPNLRDLTLDAKPRGSLRPLLNCQNLELFSLIHSYCDDYFEILTKLPKIRQISKLKAIPNRALLGQLPNNPMSLTFNFDQKTSEPEFDISPLSAVPNLKSVSLIKRAVRDISTTPQINGLEYLCISNTDVADLAPLLQCPQLEFVDISFTPAIYSQSQRPIIDQLKAKGIEVNE